MLSKNKHKAKLPEELKRHFWDVEFNELSFEKYPRFITERILNYGDQEGVKWLLSCTEIQFIKDLVENSRNLNGKTRNYWQTMLK